MTAMKIFILGAALLMVSVGCTAPVPESPTNIKETLIVATPEPLQTLNWNASVETPTSIIAINVMEGLTKLDLREGSKRALPALATQWAVSPDELKYTFKLKNKVKWTDGEKLKADDFLYAFERLLSPDNEFSGGTTLYAIKNAKAFREGKIKNFADVGIKAPDELTLVFTLDERLRQFPALFAQTFTFPLRRDLIQKFGKRWSDLDHIQTVGPYQIVKTEKRRALFLKRNENYDLAHLPSIKNITCYFGVKANEALRLFNSSQLDVFFDIKSKDLEIFQGREELVSIPLMDVNYLAFDVRQKPLTSPIFRRAIGMAIERGDVVRSVGGTAIPIGEMIPPGLVGFESNRGVRYDADAAADLLKHSHYNNLENIHFRLVVPDNADSWKVAENIQTQLKRNLGIDTKLIKYSEIEGSENLNAKSKGKGKVKDSAKEPTMYLANIRGFVPDPDLFLNVFRGKSSSNMTGWKNRNYDDLLLKASGSESVEEKEKIYAKAQHILTDEEMPVVPLFVSTNYLLVQKRVKEFPVNGFKLAPFQQVFLE